MVFMCLLTVNPVILMASFIRTSVFRDHL